MPTTVTIAFRGLMVFNYQQDAMGNNFMEIGFLDARGGARDGGSHSGHMANESPAHVPRILRMENGLLASVIDLRKQRPLGIVRNWELEVINPVETEVTLLQTGGSLNRQLPPTDVTRPDFRWIMDLEASDLHGMDLTSKISTRNLLLVLKIRNGVFSTKMHSPFLVRQDIGTGQTQPYGFSAAVTGCDIKYNAGGGVNLKAVGSTRVIETFAPKADRTTIWEISNSPPDIPGDAPIPGDAGGHFHVYYDKLFIDSPSPQFDFLAIGTAPGPDPALCGVAFLGQRPDPL